MLVLRLLLLFALVTSFAGGEMDPNGVQSTSDSGVRMDPNGGTSNADGGPGMDPNGGTSNAGYCYTACVDPNG